MANTPEKPVVVIVGRQNVGKSTLLNRFTGRRISIVSDRPGTTRDRLIANITYQDQEFTLVDTGGLIGEPDSAIDRGVNQQIQEAVNQADLVLFITDAVDGVVPADLEVAAWLRKTSKPVILVVNKADNLSRETMAADFFSLGIGEPSIISAYHNIGIDDLAQRIITLIPRSASSPSSDQGILKVALVGSPNVGKSMLVTKLLGHERVIVSHIPGTTRDAIDTMLEIDGERIILVDTAGIKRRGKVGRGVDKYSVVRSLKAIDRSDIALLVLDATEPATAQDTHVASFIEQSGKGVMLVVNKWDLISDVEQAEFNKIISSRFMFMPFAAIIYTSALTGKGVDKLIPEARKIKAERHKRIGTGELNSYIGRVVAAHQPPQDKTKVLKLLYVTQAEIEPPTFVFFVNDTKLVHFSYKRYLENRLREQYGFKGTPIQMVFKNRKGS
jgi:GTP-binding protein